MVGLIKNFWIYKGFLDFLDTEVSTSLFVGFMVFFFFVEQLIARSQKNGKQALSKQPKQEREHPAPGQNGEGEDDKDKKKSKIWKWIVGITGVAAAIVVVWVLVGISGRSDEEEDDWNAFDWIFFGVFNWSDEEEDDSSGSESDSESD